MSRRLLLIVHRLTSDPGRFARIAQSYGYDCVICRHACGDPLPETLEDYAGAVIFGGPMSANDDNLDFIRNELDWLDVPLRENKPFLGICLGAQLLARHLGAVVEPHPDSLFEVGYYPVRATEAGKKIFKECQYFYQWHGEGFSLPRGAELLARGDCFANQAYRYNKAYGIQFHAEVTREMMIVWSRMAAHRMVLAGAQARDAHYAGNALYDDGIEQWMRGFFAHWLDLEAGDGRVSVAAE